MASQTCPFGAHLQHYWDRLSPLEQQMHIDEEGLYSLAQQAVMDQITPLVPGETVIDAFCGIGGSAIGFARAGKRVTTIDSNAARLEMARYNAALFGVEGNIAFEHGNSLELLPKLHADAVFLDPPWGGPNYSKQKEFYLDDFSPSGKTLLEISFKVAPCTVIRLPKNFAMNEIESLPRKAKLQENFLGPKLMHFTAFFYE